jgi:hypothetical protein
MSNVRNRIDLIDLLINIITEVQKIRSLLNKSKDTFISSHSRIRHILGLEQVLLDQVSVDGDNPNLQDQLDQVGRMKTRIRRDVEEMYHGDLSDRIDKFLWDFRDFVVKILPLRYVFCSIEQSQKNGMLYIGLSELNYIYLLNEYRKELVRLEEFCNDDIIDDEEISIRLKDDFDIKIENYLLSKFLDSEEF